MTYSPSFNRNAKGKFDSRSSFVSIKGGTDAYLLEDELNELQWIQNEARAELIRQITNSGCLQIEDSETGLDGSLESILEDKLNSIKLKGFNAVLNGYIAHINSSDLKGNIITLPNPPINLNEIRHDFVYLEFWFSELSINDPIYEYGGINNDILNYDIIDPRLNFETSRRIQLRWAIRCCENVDPTIYPNGFIDSEGNINNRIFGQGELSEKTSFNFTQHERDKNLFIAGDGGENLTNGIFKSKLNTSDGYTYAIPLFIIERLNNAGYDATYNPNGAVDYVDENSVSGRPDGKFSNIIYVDSIKDLRVQSALGKDQNSKLYTTKEELEEYKEEIKSSVVFDVNKLQNDLFLLDDIVMNDVYRILDLKADIIYVDEEINKVKTNMSNIRLDLQNQINNIYKDINLINLNIDNTNKTIINWMNKTDDIDKRLKNLENQLKDLGFNPVLTDLVVYGVDMGRSYIATSGGIIDHNTGKVTSVGVNVSVPFDNYNAYSCTSTIVKRSDGKVGDLWYEKADTSYLVKNTGYSGFQVKTYSFKVDNNKVYMGNDFFDGSEGSGIVINRKLNPTDFVYVTPLESYYGENGDIYIEIRESDFIIKNTGSAGNAFEWTIIDTTKLRNVQVIDVDIDGTLNEGEYGQSIITGQFGEDFDVLLGSTLAPLNPPGGIGELNIETGFNHFSLIYTGKATAKVRCLVLLDTNDIVIPNSTWDKLSNLTWDEVSNRIWDEPIK